MNSRAFTEAFLRTEDELDLFNQQIGGVYFWEWIRVPVHMRLLCNGGLIGQAHTILPSTAGMRGLRAFRYLKSAFGKNPLLAAKADILFVGSSRRKMRDNGKWWDIYCDPIIANLGTSYMYMEPSYLGKHFTPPQTPNIRYLDTMFVLAGIRREFIVRQSPLTSREKRLLDGLEAEMIARFGIQIGLRYMVKDMLLKRWSELPLYTALLRRVKPKLVCVVCSYGKETFIESCKQAGITTVELQHGVVSDYHLGYSFPGPKRKKRLFTDYLFLFGDFWKEGIEYPIARDRLWTVGFPYLESEAKRYRGSDKKQQVLFISQGTVGKQMSKFAAELCERVDFPLDIVYKLHPGEYSRWRKDYPWLKGARLRVIDNGKVPLYKLFAESRLQVGVNSTAIYEGLAFGLRTILLDLPGIEHMRRLVASGITPIVSTVEELVEVFQRDNVKNIDPKVLFQHNALSNVTDAITTLLESDEKRATK